MEEKADCRQDQSAQFKMPDMAVQCWFPERLPERGIFKRTLCNGDFFFFPTERDKDLKLFIGVWEVGVGWRQQGGSMEKQATDVDDNTTPCTSSQSRTGNKYSGRETDESRISRRLGR